MNRNGIQSRLVRLQRECDVSAAPAILLCVACIVLVFMIALGAMTDVTTPTQAAEPVHQPTAPTV